MEHDAPESMVEGTGGCPNGVKVSCTVIMNVRIRRKRKYSYYFFKQLPGTRSLVAPMQVSYAADAADILDALTALDPIYAAGVELAQNSSTRGLRAWHVTLVSVEDYRPIFGDGYLLTGTNAAVTVRDRGIQFSQPPALLK